MNKEGTEENFLRAKNTAVYESNNMVTDVQSGEILYQEKSTKVKTSTEPDFIKVYYKAMMAVNAISEIPLDFLLALSAQIGFMEIRLCFTIIKQHAELFLSIVILVTI